jgi:hypothetical protein
MGQSHPQGEAQRTREPRPPETAVFSARIEPTFLPLTVAVTRSAESDFPRKQTTTVRRRADEVNRAAAHCWTALLGGCESTERRTLPSRLVALSEATSAYAGTRWWFGHGSAHRRRVVEAQSRISEAVREGDGAEFAEAFIGYDHAIATAVVSVPSWEKHAS